MLLDVRLVSCGVSECCAMQATDNRPLRAETNERRVRLREVDRSEDHVNAGPFRLTPASVSREAAPCLSSEPTDRMLLLLLCCVIIACGRKGFCRQKHAQQHQPRAHCNTRTKHAPQKAALTRKKYVNCWAAGTSKSGQVRAEVSSDSWASLRLLGSGVSVRPPTTHCLSPRLQHSTAQHST